MFDYFSKTSLFPRSLVMQSFFHIPEKIQYGELFSILGTDKATKNTLYIYTTAMIKTPYLGRLHHQSTSPITSVTEGEPDLWLWPVNQLSELFLIQ